MRSKILLAFDYGQKYIGVAVGQTLSKSATPLCTIRHINKETTWNEIGALIQSWEPSMLIVGLPTTLNDEEQLITRQAKRFARKLNGRFKLPVELINEQLSSYEAKTRLHAEDFGDKIDCHAVAAQIILEGWFSQNLKI